MGVRGDRAITVYLCNPSYQYPGFLNFLLRPDRKVNRRSLKHVGIYLQSRKQGEGGQRILVFGVFPRIGI